MSKNKTEDQGQSGVRIRIKEQDPGMCKTLNHQALKVRWIAAAGSWKDEVHN